MSQTTFIETSNTVSTYPFLLNGRMLTEGTLKDVRAPFGGEVVGRCFYATRAHADVAAASAERAFETTRKLPAFERQRVLQRIAQELTRRREELATLLAREAGKPIRTARLELDRAIFTFQVAAEESTRIYGEALPMDVAEIGVGRWGIVRRFPVGPIVAITPFNFPLNLVAHKIAPAIAAGCTMVLKPAPQCPLSALALAQIIQQAGWPDGALNVLPLTNEDASALVENNRFKMLTFTGSSKVGWGLRSRAGFKRVVLELGGNAAVLVHGDSDLAYAAERCATGAFAYAGQSCISVQRIFVERAAFGRFTELLVEQTKRLMVGDPLDEATDVGPMISEAEAIRAHEWVDEAVGGGARLLCGGNREGSLLSPTVLTATKPESRVNSMEIFAPVATVEPYDTFEEALRRANDSPFGLQAGVFTRDVRLVFRAFEELQVGGVIAGDIPSWRSDQMPYGGVKQSGVGREGLRYSIEEMTDRKLLVVKSN